MSALGTRSTRKREEWAAILATEARSLEEKLLRHNASYIQDFQHLSQRVSATGLAETITFYLGTDPALTRHSRIILGNDLLREYIEKEDVSVRDFLNCLSTSLQFIKNSKYTVKKDDVRLFNFTQTSAGTSQSNPAPAAAMSSNTSSAASQQTTTQPERPWKKGIPKFEFNPDKPRPATVSEEVWNLGPDNQLWKDNMDSLLGDAFLYGARFWCLKGEANEQPQVWKVRVFRFWLRFMLHAHGFNAPSWVNVLDTLCELEIRVLNWPDNWGVPGRDFKEWRPAIKDGLDEVLEIICGVREGDPVQVVPWTEEEKNVRRHVKNDDYLKIPLWVSASGKAIARVEDATNIWIPRLSIKNAAEDHPDIPLERSRAIIRPKTSASGQPLRKKRGAERAGPSRQRQQAPSHSEQGLELVGGGSKSPVDQVPQGNEEEQDLPYEDFDYDYDFPNGYGHHGVDTRNNEPSNNEEGYDGGYDDAHDEDYDDAARQADEYDRIHSHRREERGHRADVSQHGRHGEYERTQSHRREERGQRGNVFQRNRRTASPRPRSSSRCGDLTREVHSQRQESPKRQRTVPPGFRHHGKENHHQNPPIPSMTTQDQHANHTANVVRGLMGVSSPPPPPPPRKVVADIRQLQRSDGRRFASESVTTQEQSPSRAWPSYRRGDIPFTRPPQRDSVPMPRRSAAPDGSGLSRQGIRPPLAPRERGYRSDVEYFEEDHRRKRRRVSEANFNEER